MSVSVTQFQAITGYVYRAITVADYLANQGLITPTQSAAVLAAYNASIAAAGPVASLYQAARLVQDNCAILWVAGTLKTATASFGNALLAAFADQDVNGRPVSNWGTLIVGLSSTFT